jgi:hypothetical protein
MLKQAFDMPVSPLVRRRDQVDVITFRSVGLWQLLKDGGHCGRGGSDWAHGADGWGLVVLSLALFVLIVEGLMGLKEMAVLPMAGRCGFSGIVVVMASWWDREVVRHVGWWDIWQAASNTVHGGLHGSSS